LIKLLALFDDTDGDGLFHVSNGESSERGILTENFNTHRFGGYHSDHTGHTGLHKLGEFFQNLTSSSVNGRKDFFEFDGNMAGMAIQDGGITRLDLTGMVKNDDLSSKVLNFLCGVVLGIRADVTSPDVLDRHGLDVESDVVTGDGFSQRFVMHLDGFDIGLDHDGGKSDAHVGSEDTSFNSSDGDRSDTTDLVDILEGESEGFVSGSFGGDDSVQSFKKSHSFVPGEVVGSLHHVITVPSGNGDEGDVGGVISNFL
jgi:hypothetical protein